LQARLVGIDNIEDIIKKLNSVIEKTKGKKAETQSQE